MPQYEEVAMTFSRDHWHLLADAADEVAEEIEGGDPGNAEEGLVFRGLALEIRSNL